MPRRPRFSTGGYVFHVLNRAVGRQTIFHTEGDYAAFQQVLEEARHQVPMRVLAFCVTPNHWHLVLWPGNRSRIGSRAAVGNSRLSVRR